ncbi:hypothetical protein ACOSQ2_017275 [Xanthoceras sorbifolium]
MQKISLTLLEMMPPTMRLSVTVHHRDREREKRQNSSENTLASPEKEKTSSMTQLCATLLSTSNCSF